jgi:hypothetical protein
MLIASIGLPPGAEVDRDSLDLLTKERERSVWRYDIEPDRVILYLWPREKPVSAAFIPSALRHESEVDRICSMGLLQSQLSCGGAFASVRD